ncbi:uncharacterized protein UTRI_02776 [Ustilago trichophora]|uniref:Uncharacterized protein n=1 Tax=Ustilago trichophora TaxID=86804 RepID=A0A5C3ES82_9BASI|nr:uncharacterized protein UTRI_02776 [Ustilago trichophora]
MLSPLILLGSRWVLILLLAATLARCAGESSSGSTSSRKHASISAFIQKYSIIDPGTEQLATYGTYDRMSRYFKSRFDAKYYDYHINKVHREGVRRLVSMRPVTTPEMLRSHPQYIDFVDGDTHTPVVFVRVTDILPTNSRNLWNPDVAIFMHRITVSQLTHAQWWLQLRYIIRGGTLDGVASPGLFGQTVYEYPDRQDGSRWLNEVDEIYKWGVLRELEGLGYEPESVLHDVSTFEQAVPASIYSLMSQDKLSALLRNSLEYLMKFNIPRGEIYFKQYAQMRSGIEVDGTMVSENWFQIPIFNRFRPSIGKYVLPTYRVGHEQKIGLDRIQYKATIDSNGRSALVPQAIIRPIRIIPSLAFKTVLTIPDELKETRTYYPKHLRSLDTPLPIAPETLRGRSDPPSSDLVFGKPRPPGHPLTLSLARSQRLRTFYEELLHGASSTSSVVHTNLDHFQDEARTTPVETFRSDPVEQSETNRWPFISEAHDLAEPSEVYRMQQQVQSPARVELSDAIQDRGKRPYEASPFTQGSPFHEHPPAPVPMNIDRGLLQPLVSVPTEPRSSSLHGYQSHESHAVQPVAPQLVSPPQPQPHSQYHHQHEYRLGEKNPYEIPRENFEGDFVDVLTKHFKPELEDEWRYLHRM